MHPRVTLLLLLGLLLGTSRAARADCERDECSLLHTHGGVSVVRSRAFTTDTHSVDRYGLFTDQHMVGLSPAEDSKWPHLVHGAVQLSLGIHDGGGPPGGSLVLAGGYGRLLTLGQGPAHGPFGSLSARQSFSIDRAMNHYIVRLPEVDLGYGIFAEALSMRASLFAGLELFATERLKAAAEDDSWTHEHVAAPSLGAKLGVATTALRFELDVHRVYPRDSTLRLDRSRFLACMNLGLAGVCGQASVLRVHDPSLAVEPRGLQVGLSAGVGLGVVDLGE